MVRPERPLDPEAGPVERLAWELRQLRNEAGRPSYQELARRAHYSRSTLAEIATGLRLPTLEATVAYALACGGSEQQWANRWHETAEAVRQSRLRCPYPGLAPFTVEHADLFHGRSRLRGELVEAVGNARLVALFGASGSGKSSLLCAGLLPSLGAASTEAALITPGTHPLDAFADAFSASVVVIDQFEETFTLCADEDERDKFLALLVDAVRDENVPRTFVLAVRSDFYGHCARHHGLAAVLRENVQLPIGPPDETELREIITAPASRVGLEVEPDLVTTVIADAAGEPGALPMVSHSLRETWHRHPGRTLTLAGYRAIGGVRGSITRTAESLYSDLAAGEREIVRAVLTRLTALGDQTRDTGRRLSREELNGIGDAGEVDAVIDLLAARRLVSLDGDSLDIAHEALLQAWPRLRGWLTDDREALRAQHRLSAAAAEWDRNGRHHEFLYRGGRLSAWDREPPVPLNDLERAFLTAGRAHETAAKASARRRVRLASSGLGVVAMVISVLVVVALVQSARSAEERDRALSRRLAAQARAQLTVDPELALLLAIKAYETEPTDQADAALRQATFDARLRHKTATAVRGVKGMAATPDRRRIAVWGTLGDPLQVWTWQGARPVRDEVTIPTEGLTSGMDSVALSPDGRRLAAGMSDGTVRVWNLTTGRAAPPTVLRPGMGKGVAAVSFGPGGRLATTHAREVWIWSLDDKRKPVTVPVGGIRATGASFSSDGETLATTGLSAPPKIWSFPGGRPKVVHSGRGGGTGNGHEHLAFSPDGTWTALTRLGRVEVWDARDGHYARIADDASAEGSVFTADGRRLATRHGQRRISIWTSGNDRDPLHLYVPGTEKTVATSFSPDGRTLAGIGTDGTLRLWDVGISEVNAGIPLSGHPGDGVISALSSDGGTVAGTSLRGDVVRIWSTTDPRRPLGLRARQGTTLALSPDGRWIAGGGRDGTVRVLDLSRTAQSKEPHTLQSNSASVQRVVFSPDGSLVAGAGPALTFGGGVQVWRVSAGKPPTALNGWHKAPDRADPAGAMAFSRDGRRLAGGRSDHNVVVWDLSGRSRPTVLRGHRSPLREVAFSPDGRRLATVAEDGAIRIWKTEGGAEPLAVLHAAPSPIRTAAFSPDGDWLATTEPEGGIRFWRTTGDSDPLVVKGFGSTATHLAFRPGGTQMTIAFTQLMGSNGKPVRTGLAGRVLRIWPCDICGPGDRVLAQARQRITRQLSQDERRLFQIPA